MINLTSTQNKNVFAVETEEDISSEGGPGVDDDFRETYHPLFDKYKVDLALQAHFHAYERLYPISFNHEDEDEPIILNDNPSSYKNPQGTIFITAGTGGAHDMKLSSITDYSAAGIDEEFGILNIDIKDSGTRLIRSFIDNNGNGDLGDQFQIIKEKIKN